MKWMKVLLATGALLAALSAPALAEDRGWQGEHEHGWRGGIWGGDDHGGWWGGDDDADDGYYVPYAQSVPYVDPYSIAQGYGYQDGYSAGAYDGAYQRGYGYRDGYYRHGDHGYRRSYGDRGRYRSWYRQSYMRGYAKGYRERGGHRGH